MRGVDPFHYTRNYYLTDASGYKEFKKSFGKILEPRLERIVKEIPLKKDMDVLDVGCGRGELVFWSVKNGARKSVGIDYSEDAIKLAEKARSKRPEESIKKTKFYHMDAKELIFKNNSFDAVYLTEVLEHLYPEEQELILKKIRSILRKDGFLFIHTAPSKWFNDYTYKFWVYPLGTRLVSLSNFALRHKYGNLQPPDEIRTKSHLIMHVNEPDYISLKKLFDSCGFKGKIRSTNVTVSKPDISWKDKLFNFLVYLIPLSHYPPLNILWGNDFYAVLRKK